MTKQRSDWVFDAKHYDLLNQDRAETFAKVFAPLQKAKGLKTALDLGCGIGHFSSFLSEQGLDVLGVDGREENVLEARRRYPHLKFEVADVQDTSVASLGIFDLVFCYGLLYHLENPFSALRAIGRMTRSLAALESVVYPSPEPLMILLEENDAKDQGLNYIAYYPSESSLVKMLASSGLPYCYWPSNFPANPVYQIGRNGFRYRTFLFAANSVLDSDCLVPWHGHVSDFSPWAMSPLYSVPTALSRAYGFFDRNFRHKVKLSAQTKK